ncbi:MAG: hypothetical protein ACXW1U_18135 [Methylobacter sp.]
MKECNSEDFRLQRQLAERANRIHLSVQFRMRFGSAKRAAILKKKTVGQSLTANHTVVMKLSL